MNFMDIKSIKKIILVSKKFNVLSENNKSFLLNASKGFIFCCRKGYINEAKWLWSFCKNITYNIDCFVYSCEYGHIDIAKWLFSLGKPSLNVLYDAVLNAVKNGYFEIVKWLHSLGGLNINNCNKYSGYTVFELCCMRGYFDLVIWLFNLDATGNNYIGDALSLSCKNGHTKIAKFLYGNIKEYYFFDDEKMFCDSCINGHIETAKWVHSERYTTIQNKHYQYTFHMCCRRGYLGVAQWIYSVCNININKMCTFFWSCGNGNMDSAEWLYSLGINNISCEKWMDMYFNSHKNIFIELILNKYSNNKKINIIEFILKQCKCNEILFDKTYINTHCNPHNDEFLENIHKFFIDIKKKKKMLSLCMN